MAATYGPRLEFDFPSGPDYTQAIVQAAGIQTIPGVKSFYGDEGTQMREDVREALEEALEVSLGIDYPQGVGLMQVRREAARVTVTLSAREEPNDV